MEYKFSVSICVYGGDNAEYFDTALESVFSQTLPPDEVVLVVDGPVGENIEDVIKKYESKYNSLKVIRSEKNVGLGNARRMGLENCSFDLVALMDADDICVNNRFEKQIEAFKRNENLSIVGGQIKEFIGTPENVVGMRLVPLEDSKIKEYMKKRCPMNHPTVMLKKQDVQVAGGYMDWHYNEDYYLWIRMSMHGANFDNLPDSLLFFRTSDEMYRRRGGLKYFKSEKKLQKYMLDNKIISNSRYVINVTERLILQVLMPNKLRGIIFRIFARKKEIKRYD